MAEVVNDQLTCELARGEDEGMTDVQIKYGVSSDCRARSHNTLRAAEDRNKTGIRCTCPQALEILKTRRERQRAVIRDRGRVRADHARNRELQLSRVTSREVTARTPDFRYGYCTTPAGRDVARAAQADVMTLASIAAMNQAKRQCVEKCPLLAVCRAWVMAQEQPAGSWGSVWGGLDPWNRQGKTLTFRDGKAEVIPYVGH